jgi:hypothetical protein
MQRCLNVGYTCQKARQLVAPDLTLTKPPAVEVSNIHTSLLERPSHFWRKQRWIFSLID